MKSRFFIPITKVDVAKQLVYGTAADETPDRQGEIWDYAGNKPLWSAWSEGFVKATGGKSAGNLRAMHNAVAAGKFTEVHFDDEKRSMEVCAKVVDAAEWEKVQEGVYTGFSVGGEYVKSWADKAIKGVNRVIIEPVEISLADLGANPSALFTAIKADGMTELRAFKAVREAAAPQQLKLPCTAPAFAKKFMKAQAAKGLWTVANMADLLQQLSNMVASVTYERDFEGDKSDIPERLAAALEVISEVFIDMTEEEVEEMLDGIAV
jgi:hypothetical protein